MEIEINKKEKPPVFLSILKWYSLIYISLIILVMFLLIANMPYVDGVTMVTFIMPIPVLAYLCSLASRRIT